MTIELRAAGKRFGLGQRVIAAEGINLIIGPGEFVAWRPQARARARAAVLGNRYRGRYDEIRRTAAQLLRI
jgi:hypothetical protein